MIANMHAQEEILHRKDFPIFANPEIPPVPRNISFKGIQASILNRIEYPSDFQKEGFVVIRFMVNLDGKVLSPRISKGIDPKIDQQILNLICGFEFIPGKFFEKEVPMVVNFPLWVKKLFKANIGK